MKSILDRSFKYIPSGQTDLRKTFARIRREQKERQPIRLEDKRKEKSSGRA